MSKYTMKVGKDFEIDVVDIEDVKILDGAANLIDKAEKANTRKNLTYIILFCIFVAILVASYLGYSDGSYDELSAVWTSSSWGLGFILGAYFVGGSKK